MSEEVLQGQIDLIRRYLRETDAVVVLTGAGVSAESGIPTFRNAQTGLWARYDPMELATPQAFARDPALVSCWYDERRRKSAAPRPSGLDAAPGGVRGGGEALYLITQKVDRLHQRAGSRDLLEPQGTFWVWRCTSCGEERGEWEITFPEYPPRCHCGGTRRPGVVWFGETLPESVLAAAWQAAEP